METNQKAPPLLSENRPPAKQTPSLAICTTETSPTLAELPLQTKCRPSSSPSIPRIRDDLLLYSIFFDKIRHLHVLASSVGYDNHNKMLHCANVTSTRYKISKYRIAAKGDLVLKACMTFRPDSASPALVLQMPNAIQNRLRKVPLL